MRTKSQRTKSHQENIPRGQNPIRKKNPSRKYSIVLVSLDYILRCAFIFLDAHDFRLAFCPKNKVTAAFETLSEIILEEAIPIMDYFQDTYIGKPHRRGRRSPIFDIDIWNMYSRVSNDLSKSNNSGEGWHHSFQSSLTCDHPIIWVFLRILQKEQGLQDAIRT